MYLFTTSVAAKGVIQAHQFSDKLDQYIPTRLLSLSQQDLFQIFYPLFLTLLDNHGVK